MRRSATIGTFIVVLGALLSGASTAAADSIVYQKDGNVWLANPDGSGQYQVTLDGTAADPYESPSQADDGTIMAARGDGRNRRLYRMRQNGQLLNEPIAAVTPPLDPRLSADGTKAAYWFLSATTYFGCDYCIGIYGQTIYTYPDRLTRYEEVNEPYCCYNPSWVGNEGVLMDASNATIWFHRYGSSDTTKQWFADSAFASPPQELIDPELTTARDKLALVRGDSRETLQLYSVAGGPPSGTALPAPGCRFENPTGVYESPSWAPDGSALVWQEGDGIWVSPVPSTSDCAAINAAGGARLLIPGAARPDWGPANVNPGPRPVVPGGGGSGGGGGTGGPGGTGGATGGGGGASDTTPPAFTAAVGRPPRLGKALSSGFDVTVTTDEAGTASATASVSGKDARGLKVAAVKTAAKGSAKLKGAGTYKVKLRFTKKAKKKFRRYKKLKVTVKLKVADGSGNGGAAARKITLKR